MTLGLSACGEDNEIAAPDGFEASEVAEVPANEKLARYLALSLKNPGLRQGLLQAMRASPVYEGKLFFASYLRSPANGLLAHMARAGGVSRSEVIELVSQLPPLEIYLPVPEHREEWTGGVELIVATTLSEDIDPYGVTPSGEEVQLQQENPPAIPTIVIVPAEGFYPNGLPVDGSLRQPPDPAFDENCDPDAALTECDDEPAGGGGALCDAPSGPDERGIGIRERIFCIRHLNAHEGFTSGMPEFDIRLAGTEDGDLFAELNGRRRIPDQTWDGVEEGDWVEFQTNLFDLDTDVGNRIRIQCHEDDADADDQFQLSGSTTFDFGVVSFEFSFQNIFGNGDDPCGNYELLIKTSTGQFTTMQQSKSTPDGTSELEWLTYGVDLTS